MKTKLPEFIKRFPLPVYFLLAYAITWIGSTIHVLSLLKNGPILPPLANFPGALVWYYGPCLSAVIVTRICGGKDSLRNLLKRLVDWRVSWRWYAFIVLYPLALHLAVVYLDRLLGGPAPVFFRAEGIPEGPVWLVLLLLILYQILVRGIGEETGWRGFALPGLQSRWNALSASLILGVLWGLWHFHPANFPGLLSIGGIFIFINITLTAVIFTWVYNHTRGSAFMAAMFHMTLNVVEFVVPIGLTEAGLTRNLLQIGLLLVTVTALVLISGPQLGKGEKLPLPALNTF